MWWVDPEAEVRARMRDRVREADRWRLAARVSDTSQAPACQSLARYWWRLRQAAGFGLVRTGLWLLSARRA